MQKGTAENVENVHCNKRKLEIGRTKRGIAQSKLRLQR